MVYINRFGDGQRETVDHFDTYKDANEALKHYRAADTAGRFWISPRACRGWTAQTK